MASLMTPAGFVQKFHSLTGTTIGERRQVLFQLLNEAVENKLNVDFTQLHTETALEENFKLEALLYFKSTTDLCLLLTKGNPILVHKIVKKASPILIQHLSCLTALELLHFLSQISLNAKLKLLNKCGQKIDNTEKAEEFFHAIRDKYGIHLATKLLTACSAEFIMGFLESSRFKFTSSQLLLLVKKYPQHVHRFLGILQKRVNITQEYRNVFEYLSKHNVSLFLGLHNTYKLDTIPLGWRATNSFINSNKDDVIGNAKIYLEILKNKHIKKSLSREEYYLFYYNLFPPLITHFYRVYDQILSLAPNSTVFFEGYRRKYGTEFLNESKLINSKLLQMLPSEVRLKILTPEFKPSDMSDDEWICYLKTSESIELLKKRIFLTSDIKSRATLIGLLVDTCSINKDEVALLEMCDYMVKQHRNDHISVRLSFLRAIKKCFKMENLSMLHWKSINELIQIFQLNGEEFFHIEDFMLAYIECCIKNQQSVKQPLTECLKRRRCWGSWNLLSEKPAYEKVCLQTISEILQDLDGDFVDNTIAYFNALMNWNARHPKDMFVLNENKNFVRCLQESSKKDDYATLRNCDSLLTYVLHTPTIPERQLLLELYISFMNTDKIRWLIQNDVNSLINNLSSYINILLRSSTSTDSFWLYCKLYTHLELPQKVINICLDMLSQESLDDKKLIKKNALLAFSYLMPTNKLLTLTYSVGPYMKNCTPDLLVIETILKYCSTNSLPSVKRTIFSSMNNLNETNLLNLIVELIKIKYVHVRKIALYILFRTMEKKVIMKVLKDFLADPNNHTLNRFVLSTVLKYFSKNPNDYLWNLIQLSAEAFDADDEDAYNLLIQPNKIPEEYLIRYILFVWERVEKLPGFFNENGVKLLQVAKAHILPSEFCESIINKYFFSYQKNYSNFYLEVQAFVCKYVCHNPANVENYVTKVLHLDNTINLQSRGYVNHFVKQMCYECIRQNKKEVLQQFARHWNVLRKPHDMFEEYLCIQVSLIKVENSSIPEIAKRLVELCVFLTDTYGNEILYSFAQEIRILSEEYLIKSANDHETEMNRFSLIENIVECNSSTALIILGILLIKDRQPSMVETKNKHDALTDLFSSKADSEIRVYLNDL